MRVIGLTGGIACGKSLVSAWLAEQPGCAVVDGDLLSRELTAPGGAALPAIRQVFGEKVFSGDGVLNRRALGRIVFGDPEAREALDDLMAPLLRNLTLARTEQARAEGYALCVLDYPLLFEKGYDSLCDSVWCVTLPRALQLKRLMTRDHLTESEALQRMDAVLSTEEKAARSQVIIDNSGDRAFTLSTLPPLFSREMELAASPRRRRARPEALPANSTAPADALRSGSSPDRGASPGAPESLRRRQTPPEEESFARSGVMHPEAPESPDSRRAADQLEESIGRTTMERPASTRRKTERRKAPWSLPSWLIWMLSVTLFLVLASVTAQALMQAYLVRQEEKHLKEQRDIYANYPLEYREIIERTAAEFNLNPAFVSAIVRNESSFQPQAVSNVGARGLMQLMPDTAEWIAHKLGVTDYAFERMYDPESNVRFGCWYLRYLSSLFGGDPICVTCAYHAGQGQVTNWLSDARYSGDGVRLNLDNLPDGPTKTYAGRVIRSYGIYQALYFTVAQPDAPGDADLDGSGGR